jgi:hypothetical protein
MGRGRGGAEQERKREGDRVGEEEMRGQSRRGREGSSVGE